MKRVIAALGFLTASCGADQTHPAIETRIVTQTVEVQVPCPATIPPRPAKLAQPLPTDAVKLAATLAVALAAYSAPGGWADRAEAAMAICHKATP